MSGEREKMLAGELYDPLDPELVAGRERARALHGAERDPRDRAQRASPHPARALRRRRRLGLDAAAVLCDYGANIELGERVFFNFNCMVLDVCRVRIGDFTLFGPAVQILTPLHPLDPVLRRSQEYGKPIEIGSDVWVGGGALILRGREASASRR